MQLRLGKAMSVAGVFLATAHWSVELFAPLAIAWCLFGRRFVDAYELPMVESPHHGDFSPCSEASTTQNSDQSRQSYGELSQNGISKTANENGKIQNNRILQ